MELIGDPWRGKEEDEVMWVRGIGRWDWEETGIGRQKGTDG